MSYRGKQDMEGILAHRLLLVSMVSRVRVVMRVVALALPAMHSLQLSLGEGVRTCICRRRSPLWYLRPGSH